MTFLSTLDQRSSHNLFCVIKAMRIHEMDLEISRIVSRRPLDLMTFEMIQDEDIKKVFARNILVINLFESDRQIRAQYNEDSVVRHMTLSYLAAMLSINCLGISYLLHMPLHVQLFGAAFAISFLSCAIFNTCYKWRSDKISHDLYETYRKKFFTINYKGVLEDPCMICLEDLRNGHKVTGHMASGKVPHFFHRKCVEMMVSSAGTSNDYYFSCPCCRKSVITAQVELG